MLEQLGIATLDDLKPNSRVVITRVDINSPVDASTKIVTDDSRIREHSRTVKELSGKGAKVVILAHQGRKGDPDFTSLEQHAKILSGILSWPVRFVPDVAGEEAKGAIKSMKPGDVLMLDNVRFLSEETAERSPKEHSRGTLVSALGPLADYFVNDAFAAAHRSHASIVGFAAVLPSAAGRVMEKELAALSKVAGKPEKPSVYVIAGAKPKESFKVAQHVLSNGIADDVLTGGLVANVFLKAKGFKLGEANEKLLDQKGFAQFVSGAREMLGRFPGRIVTPVDLAVEIQGGRSEIAVDDLPTNHYIKDIGKKTVELYGRLLMQAKSIVVNGPLGVYEEDNFSLGTREILRVLTKTEAFSVVGGGHSLAAVYKFGLEKKLPYVSTAGGALISYLSGEALPGVEALKAASKKFS
ncbi:MAG: phosphoglycerate kinase [Candidatus Brockarchaeota archaeon]|nr:phosphoglycerate kinase [Candidatus Brockarchaeota archaeon]